MLAIRFEIKNDDIPLIYYNIHLLMSSITVILGRLTVPFLAMLTTSSSVEISCWFSDIWGRGLFEDGCYTSQVLLYPVSYSIRSMLPRI